MKKFVYGLIFLIWSAGVNAANVTHIGPSIELTIERKNEKLPLSKVDKLAAGDKFYASPVDSSLSKEDWILIIAQISPTGSNVKISKFNLTNLKEKPFVEIQNQDDSLVIVLAPQLRTFFGLTRSFSGSADTIDQIINSDPQKFFELQKLDLFNKAIQIINKSIENSGTIPNGNQAIQAVKQTVIKYGVKNINSECFKDNTVNIECVAANFVSNIDFSERDSRELDNPDRSKNSFENLGFLGGNIKLITDAGNFLTDKFRDRYTFSPAFATSKSDSRILQIYSFSRFKSGDIKIAYAFAPSWQKISPPILTSNRDVQCVSKGNIEISTLGRLPTGDYWHSWNIDFFDKEKNEIIGSANKIKFNQEENLLTFAVPNISNFYGNEFSKYEARISGKYAFQDISINPIPLNIAKTYFSKTDFLKLNDLISKEKGSISLKDTAKNNCIKSLELERDDHTIAKSNPTNPTELQFDLGEISPGPAKIIINQYGSTKIVIEVLILPPKTKISSIEHVEFDRHITASGADLDRIDFIKWGEIICKSKTLSNIGSNSENQIFDCGEEVTRHLKLPDTVTVFHKKNSPASLRISIKKIDSHPQISLADNNKNAVLITPSVKAVQWGLTPSDKLLTEDSGLHLLLVAKNGYSLAKSSFQLQIRIKDDPESEKRLIKAPLISDAAKGELRTRNPIYFKDIDFPSVINPLEFRIIQQQTGLGSRWAELKWSVITIPNIQSVTCQPESKAVHIHGSQLEIIDGIYSYSTGDNSINDTALLLDKNMPIENCDDGLCLRLISAPTNGRMIIKLRWAENFLFKVKIFDDLTGCE